MKPSAASIDMAWAAVEVALPAGWWISSLALEGVSVETFGGDRDRITWWEAIAKGPKGADAIARSHSPAEALFLLADGLVRHRGESA
jgi:hypothetical protein